VLLRRREQLERPRRIGTLLRLLLLLLRGRRPRVQELNLRLLLVLLLLQRLGRQREKRSSAT
jgi:hypothetical protein